jgi:hypothetical protein
LAGGIGLWLGREWGPSPSFLSATKDETQDLSRVLFTRDPKVTWPEVKMSLFVSEVWFNTWTSETTQPLKIVSYKDENDPEPVTLWETLLTDRAVTFPTLTWEPEALTATAYWEYSIGTVWATRIYAAAWRPSFEVHTEVEQTQSGSNLLTLSLSRTTLDWNWDAVRWEVSLVHVQTARTPIDYTSLPKRKVIPAEHWRIRRVSDPLRCIMEVILDRLPDLQLGYYHLVLQSLNLVTLYPERMRTEFVWYTKRPHWLSFLTAASISSSNVAYLASLTVSPAVLSWGEEYASVETQLLFLGADGNHILEASRDVRMVWEAQNIPEDLEPTTVLTSSPYIRPEQHVQLYRQPWRVQNLSETPQTLWVQVFHQVFETGTVHMIERSVTVPVKPLPQITPPTVTGWSRTQDDVDYLTLRLTVPQAHLRQFRLLVERLWDNAYDTTVVDTDQALRFVSQGGSSIVLKWSPEARQVYRINLYYRFLTFRNLVQLSPETYYVQPLRVQRVVLWHRGTETPWSNESSSIETQSDDSTYLSLAVAVQPGTAATTARGSWSFAGTRAYWSLYYETGQAPLTDPWLEWLAAVTPRVVNLSETESYEVYDIPESVVFAELPLVTGYRAWWLQYREDTCTLPLHIPWVHEPAVETDTTETLMIPKRCWFDETQQTLWLEYTRLLPLTQTVCLLPLKDLMIQSSTGAVLFTVPEDQTSLPATTANDDQRLLSLWIQRDTTPTGARLAIPLVASDIKPTTPTAVTFGWYEQGVWTYHTQTLYDTLSPLVLLQVEWTATGQDTSQSYHVIPGQRYRVRFTARSSATATTQEVRTLWASLSLTGSVHCGDTVIALSDLVEEGIEQVSKQYWTGWYVFTLPQALLELAPAAVWLTFQKEDEETQLWTTLSRWCTWDYAGVSALANQNFSWIIAPQLSDAPTQTYTHVLSLTEAATWGAPTDVLGYQWSWDTLGLVKTPSEVQTTDTGALELTFTFTLSELVSLTTTTSERSMATAPEATVVLSTTLSSRRDVDTAVWPVQHRLDMHVRLLWPTFQAPRETEARARRIKQLLPSEGVYQVLTSWLDTEALEWQREAVLETLTPAPVPIHIQLQPVSATTYRVFLRQRATPLRFVEVFTVTNGAVPLMWEVFTVHSSDVSQGTVLIQQPGGSQRFQTLYCPYWARFHEWNYPRW